MKFMKRIPTIFIATFLILPVLVQHGTAFTFDMPQGTMMTTDTICNHESHVIEGVPCIGIDTRFYCTISSQTMILNYYHYNFSKYEVLYFMGGGFSLFYNPPRYLIPYSSVGCAFRPSNHDFIASLLGMDFIPFNVDLEGSENITWDSVWSCIKQNILMDRPVMVNLDQLVLFAKDTEIPLVGKIIDLFPVHADHAITVVGFNETNQSICYNNPINSFFGPEEEGAYRWVDIETFKASFDRFTKFSPFFPSSYRIIAYIHLENSSYMKKDVIEKVFERNIKRLKGDFRYYVSDIDFPDSYNLTANFSYGINASRALKNLFGNGVKHQLDTLYHYKTYYKLGITNTLFSWLEQATETLLNKDISYILDLTIKDYKNMYQWIAEEKRYVSSVLNNYSNVSQKYYACSQLLKQEAENWSNITAYNKILMTKGMFISALKGIWILQNMEKTMENIIQIEQEIISLENITFIE